ncbi:MAG: hypothetical protein NVSMB16_06980 [Acidimicrobiales bacterium]
MSQGPVTSPDDPGESSTHRRPTFGIPEAAVAGVAALAATWAVVVSKVVFPFGSINHDEPVYRIQADALLHGHLFPIAPRHPAAFVPWLTAYRNGRYIPKYTPVHASVLAMGRVLFGTDRAGLGVLAASVVVVTYLLAREVLGSRIPALLAAITMAGSPIFLLQSATFLTYTTGLLLTELISLCVLIAVRTGRARWFVLAGFAAGLAFFARPYDAVVFSVPWAAFVVWRGRSSWQGLVRQIGWLAGGAAAPLAAVLAFDRAATGSALRPPFGLIDASDSIGFGKHRMYPTDPYVHFTAREGALALLRQLGLTGFWCFGGLILIGLAVFALWHRDRHDNRWWIAASALAIPAGYLFFWGNYGSTIFGLPRYLGPFYYLPAFAPIAVLGAAGFVKLWHADHVVASCGAVAMVALSVFVAGRTLRTDARLSADDRRLNHGLTSAHLDHALVFLPPIAGPELLLPFGTAINHYGYTGRIVYALDQGPEGDAAIAADFPDRRPYVLVVSGTYRADPPDRTLTSSLEPLGY